MYLIYDIPTGKIEAQQSQNFTTSTQGAYWCGGAAPDMRQRFYIVDGEMVDRPAPPTFPASGVAPLVVDLSQIVPGSVLTVMNRDEQTLQITTFDEPLTLTGGDIYALDLAQPFPHRNVTTRIEVTDA